MAVDTSMFNRPREGGVDTSMFKSVPAPKPKPEQVLADALPLTMGGALRPAQAEAPKSAVATFAKAIPEAAGTAWDEWTASEKKRRAEQSIGQEAYTDLVKRPAKIIGKGVGMIAGGLSELGKTFMELGGTYVRAGLTDEDIGTANLKMQQYLYDDEKRKEIEKKLFGFEAKSYGDWQPGIAKYLEDSNALPVEKKTLPYLLPFLALSADLFPGGKPATIAVRKTLEELAQETGEVAIRRMLRDLAIPDEVAEPMVKQLIEANNVNKVKAVIRAGIEPETKRLTKELVSELGDGIDEVPVAQGVRATDEVPVTQVADEDILYRGQPKGLIEVQKVAQTNAVDNILIGRGVFTTTDEALARTYGDEIFRFTKPKEKVFDLTNIDEQTLRKLLPESFFTEHVVSPDRTLKNGTVMKGFSSSTYKTYVDAIKNGDIKDAEDILIEALAEKHLPDDVQWNAVKNGADVSMVDRGITADIIRDKMVKDITDAGFDWVKHRGGIRAGGGKSPHDVYIALKDEALKLTQKAPQTGTQQIRTLQAPEQTPPLRTESASSEVPTPAPKDVEKDSPYVIKVNDKGDVVKANIGDPVDKVKISREDAEAIVDISYKDTVQNIQTSRANGVMIPERNLIKEIEANIVKHSNKIPDEEVAKARNELLLEPETVLDILARKRGIVTDAEALRRATEAKATIDAVLNLPKGATLNAEQILAVKQVVQHERDTYTALKALANGNGVAQTPAERSLLKKLGYENASDLHLINEALSEAQIRLRKAEAAQYAVGSELGRSLRSYGKFVEGIEARMRTILNHAKRLPEEERTALIETLGRLDLDDDKVFLKTLDKLVKADFFDKVAEYMVAVKLWNPTTHVVNIGGNALRQVADIGIKTVTSPTVAVADWKGAAVGIKQGLGNALKALTNEGYSRHLSKHLELGGQAPAIKGVKGKVIRYPFQVLAAGDELFRSVAFNRSMYRQAFIKARKEGLRGAKLNARMKELLEQSPIDMSAKATEEAKRMTFQEDIGELIGTIDKLRTPAEQKAWYSKTFSLILRAFVPFLKTPTNLFKQALDFSPVGLLKNNKAFRTAVKEGDKEKAMTIIGEAVLGSALMFYFWEQHQDGNITGGAPREKSEKDRFYRESKLPYAIRIGNTWVQYKRVDPFATMLGLTADVATLSESGDDVTLGSVAYLLSQQLSDKTYLQGVSDLMKLLGQGETWEAEYAWKSMILGGAIPSIIGHTARSMDPNVRVADTIPERLQAVVPGASEELPTQVNVLGYDVERANKGLNYFFNPIQNTTASIDPVTRELMKIDKTVSVPQKYFVRDGKRYDLSPDEYEKYARKTGVQLRNELLELFNSSRYKSASLDKKEELIDKKRREIQDEYKDEYIKKKTGRTKVGTTSSSENIFDGVF